MVNFRKSKKVGPFRITATGSGLSVSGGVAGARVSANSKGEVRRTIGVPGTGVYDTKKISSGKPATGGSSIVQHHEGRWPCRIVHPNTPGEHAEGIVLDWWHDEDANGGWRALVDVGDGKTMTIDAVYLEMQP